LLYAANFVSVIEVDGHLSYLPALHPENSHLTNLTIPSRVSLTGCWTTKGETSMPMPLRHFRNAAGAWYHQPGQESSAARMESRSFACFISKGEGERWTMVCKLFATS
jgi:hypothetical protein